MGIDTIITVSSKSQLLSILGSITGIKYLSVTSRNSFLWKIEQGKASSILDDEDVINAINTYKEKSGDNSVIIFQEGFASSTDKKDGVAKIADAVIVSEELLAADKDQYFK